MTFTFEGLTFNRNTVYFLCGIVTLIYRIWTTSSTIVRNLVQCALHGCAESILHHVFPQADLKKKNFIEELKNNGMVQYSPIPLLQTTYKQFGNFPKADVFHSAHFRVAQLASPYKSSHRLTCDMIALA